MSDEIKRLVDHFNSFIATSNTNKTFSAQEFVAYMEPVFAQCGYREKPAPDKQLKILIVRDDAAGDFVLFSPVIREIRRIYPHAYITLLCSPRNHGLAECCPYVDNVLVNRQEFNANDFSQLFSYTLQMVVDHLLSYHFDLAFAGRLGFRSASLLTMYMCGAKERVGFTQDRINPQGQLSKVYWDCLLTHAVPFVNRSMSDVDRELMLLEDMLHAPIANRQLEVWYTMQDREAVRAKLGDVHEGGANICIMPGASLKMKCWPVERYIQLVKWILARPGNDAMNIIVLGGPADREAGDAFAAAFEGQHCINLSGRLSFRQSMAAMECCRMYIGNDTGMMHVAAALKKPILSVNCFPLDQEMAYMSVPLRFMPYKVPNVTCCPAHAKDDCHDNWRHGCSRQEEPHCILNVAVETVEKGYELLLERIRANNIQPLLVK